jgi:predicted lipoprotein with Yx(FWY)xxD motif
MMINLRNIPMPILAAILIGLAALTTSCGDDPEIRVPTANISPTEAPRAPPTVMVRETGIGRILTDARGYTLYQNVNDVAGTGISNCLDACEQLFPPLVVTPPVQRGPGIAGALGTFVRPSGVTQALYNSRPLYLHAGDAQPGDANGNGIDGIWEVARP